MYEKDSWVLSSARNEGMHTLQVWTLRDGEDDEPEGPVELALEGRQENGGDLREKHRNLRRKIQMSQIIANEQSSCKNVKKSAGEGIW